jgi:hypothetical protein
VRVVVIHTITLAQTTSIVYDNYVKFHRDMWQLCVSSGAIGEGIKPFFASTQRIACMRKLQFS